MALAAVALGVSAFLSRILGLVRDKVISYYFGASAEADVYFMAFVVPDFLNHLLAGGYFSITLVPLLARAFADDEEDGWRFLSSAVCWAALSISALTLLAWVCAPFIADCIAPGFTPEARVRLSSFLRIILPAQMCFLPGACFSAVLYYRRQFTAPALTPLIYNGCIITIGVIGLNLFPERGMEGFCWGVLVGAFLGSLCLPILAVSQGGMRFAPRLRHKTMIKVLLLALPLMLGHSIVALDEQLVRIFGSLTGEGGVSLLNYARRIMLVPVGVVAQAAGLASFPFLAALVVAGERERFEKSMNEAASNTLLVALPLSLWMLVTAEPIMRLIFQQGQFSVEAATQSGPLLAIMLASVAFWVVQQIVGRAFYAHQDTLTPALAGAAATLVALPLYWLGASHFGTMGVAAAGTLGVALYTVTLCLVWRRKHGKGGLAGLLRLGLWTLLFCLPACAAAYGAMIFVGMLAGQVTLWGAALKILAGGLVFCAVYLVGVWFFAPFLAAPFWALARKVRLKCGAVE